MRASRRRRVLPPGALRDMRACCSVGQEQQETRTLEWSLFINDAAVVAAVVVLLLEGRNKARKINPHRQFYYIIYRTTLPCRGKLKGT